jgi:hypothetical protein
MNQPQLKVANEVYQLLCDLTDNVAEMQAILNIMQSLVQLEAFKVSQTNG